MNQPADFSESNGSVCCCDIPIIYNISLPKPFFSLSQCYMMPYMIFEILSSSHLTFQNLSSEKI